MAKNAFNDSFQARLVWGRKLLGTGEKADDPGHFPNERRSETTAEKQWSRVVEPFFRQK